MSRRNAPENFFPWYGVAHGCAQEPTPGSAVKFRSKSVRKNRPLVPRSKIAGSWTRGEGVVFFLLLAPDSVQAVRRLLCMGIEPSSYVQHE